jgi:hypothetical protein
MLKQKVLKAGQPVQRPEQPVTLSRSIHFGVEELEWDVAHVSLVPAGNNGCMLPAIVVDAVARVVSQGIGSTGIFRSW